MRRILEPKYQKADLVKIASDSKLLSSNEQSMLYDSLTKYKLLFGRTLETLKTKPVDLELQTGSKPYNSNPYLFPWAHKAVFWKEVEHLYQLGLFKNEPVGEGSPRFYLTVK